MYEQQRYLHTYLTHLIQTRGYRSKQDSSRNGMCRLLDHRLAAIFTQYSEDAGYVSPACYVTLVTQPVGPYLLLTVSKYVSVSKTAGSLIRFCVASSSCLMTCLITNRSLCPIYGQRQLYVCLEKPFILLHLRSFP